MCLVEVEKSAKPVAACAMPVMNGWKVHTNSDFTRKVRADIIFIKLSRVTLTFDHYSKSL